MLKYSGIDRQSTVDGTGVRLVVFFSGCKHACEGCHNRETWNFNYGQEFTQEIKDKIYQTFELSKILKGITLSGGDPLFSASDIIPFVIEFKSKFPDKDIWLYTGFDIKKGWKTLTSDMKNLLMMCDYVVDGKYDYTQTKTKSIFRGSSNQKVYRREGNEFKDVSNMY